MQPQYNSSLFMQISIPGSKKGQSLLNCYINDSKGKSELERIMLAKLFCNSWNTEQISFPCPISNKNNDYWFLHQLIALDKFVNADGAVYNFDISSKE